MVMQKKTAVKPDEKVDVCLVSMPFSDMTMPSMALSLLKSCLNGVGISSCVQYEHLYYIKKCGIGVYNKIATTRHDTLAGEALFSRAAHGNAGKSLEEYIAWMLGFRLPMGGVSVKAGPTQRNWVRVLTQWQKEAEDFIEESAQRILAHRPKIVALVSLFQQINANIALARRLKREKNPPLILVGGANCMGDLGAASIEHIEAYDYVFIGEADEIFADVCRRLLKDGEIPPDELPYGVLSGSSPRPKNVIHRVTKDMESLPIPDFTDYFETYQSLFPDIEYKNLLVEGSRGCWWGRNKPCTFCGLNGPARNYREKTTKRLADEIEFLAKKYPEARVCVFTDSILSRRQMKELPEEIRRRGIKLRFFSEIKANLTEEDIRALAECGFAQVQPGIESLQDDVLRIMNKGCRAIRQIETLKNCRAYGIEVAWNILAGFPGEKESYYMEMAELLPKLMHLPAPNQFIHIVYQRYGEYTENPEQYGLILRPARIYDFIFHGGDFIRRSAYIFEPTEEKELPVLWDISQKGEGWRRVKEIADEWKAERSDPQRLDMEDNGAVIDIYDMRKIARHIVYHLSGVRADIYRLCRTVRTEEYIRETLGVNCGASEIEDALAWLTEENLMVHIKEEYLALAVDARVRSRREKNNG